MYMYMYVHVLYMYMCMYMYMYYRYHGTYTCTVHVYVPVCICIYLYCITLSLSLSQTMVERPATWKKLSAISQSSTNPDTMGIKIERSYHLPDEDEAEVESEDLVKGTDVNIQ